MSTKRQPSKQRRQTQNQRQRAALEARRQNVAAGSAPAGKTGSTAGAPRGSVLSRLRGASATGRAVRTSGAPATGTRNGLPVGHRAAMSALFAAIAAAVVGSIVFKVPVDRAGDPIGSNGALVAEWVRSAADVAVDQPDATAAQVAEAVDEWLPGGDEPYIQAFWPISLAVVLPVIGTGLGFRAVARRSPARLVNRTMYVTLFGALLASQLLFIFLPAVIALFVASFQVRKAETTAAATLAAESPPEGTDGDVIDVDEVDGDDDLEADDLDAADPDEPDDPDSGSDDPDDEAPRA